MPAYKLEGLKCRHMSSSGKSSRETGKISGRGMGCTTEKLQ